MAGDQGQAWLARERVPPAVVAVRFRGRLLTAVDTITPDSTDPFVAPPDEPSDPADLRRRRIRNRILAVVGGFLLLILGSIAAAALYHVPYFLLSPGGTFRTQTYIQIKGAPTYPQTGSIEYVTVSVTTGRMTALQWVLAHFDSSATIVPEDEIVPPHLTPAQNQAASLQEMADSKTVATVVALEHLGYKVEASGTGAVILAVVKDSAAYGTLKVNDTVVSFDGKPIHTNDDLSNAIHAKKPGDKITMQVEAPKKNSDSQTITVTLGKSPKNPSQGFLGVASGTRNLSFPDLPIRVSVSTPDVGGPSAGLAFTLGIMDVLTKGSLTGGHKVATTGTIDLNGCVGPIGGMHQKVLAVRRSGAEEFLVPRSELAEAKKYAGSLKVVPVDDTDDALTALTALGGGHHVVKLTPNDGEAAACKPTKGG
jgi:Lon-like protease